MTAQELRRLIRTLRFLEKILQRYSDKHIADCLVAARKYPRWHVETGTVRFVGEVLDSIGHPSSNLMPPDPPSSLACAVCGDTDGIGRPGMPDTLTRKGSVYCSPKCRQKAYRERVRARDGKALRTRGVPVTKRRNVTAVAVAE
jgi:hypothetical protein